MLVLHRKDKVRNDGLGKTINGVEKRKKRGRYGGNAGSYSTDLLPDDFASSG